MTNSVPLPSALKQTSRHFEVLDGLRGVAAISVVIFHFMEIAVPDYHDSFIAHAYLAVDFFFCLSGFVIAYAYDQRLAQIGIVNFFKLRLIRLHPLVLIGSVIGIIAFIFDPWSRLFMVYQSRLWTMFITSCLMIPYPVVQERFFNLFHLNAPAWSLFWEYVANIFYALVLVRINRKVLIGLICIAAILLTVEAQKSGYLAVGWSGDNFWGGGVRVFFSFLAGITVYRFGWIIRNRIPMPVIGLLLLLAFVFPFVTAINPFADPAIVIVYLPLIVAIGAGSQASDAVKRWCKFSGDISYPLYMIHYPFIWLFMSDVEKHKPSMSEMIWIMILGTILLTGLAYVILKWIDEPLRKRLKKIIR